MSSTRIKLKILFSPFYYETWTNGNVSPTSISRELGLRKSVEVCN